VEEGARAGNLLFTWRPWRGTLALRPVEPNRRAVIDVGTNSVKLLLAEVDGSDVRPLLETSRQTRLGQGFYQNRRLQQGPIASTAKAVSDFAARAREGGASSIRVIATSAAREALNKDELISAITRESQLPVEVISGEQEADWAFRGVVTDPSLAAVPLLLLDVGGGSTEFILGHEGRKDFACSFEMGTVRLLEHLPHSDPPSPEELATCRLQVKTFLNTQVRPKLEEPMKARQGWQLTGAGGTASVLGCIEARLTGFDRERLESTRLSLERLRWHTTHLWGMPLAERREVVGLPKKRADVILTGVVIYEAVLEQFGLAEMRVTTRGLRFAALMPPS
jgi:exopolyphosphatase / guanosine-5'-triphosphate,3'-diphosphate pyrophosphatase